jgi:hypothetical protein
VNSSLIKSPVEINLVELALDLEFNQVVNNSVPCVHLDLNRESFVDGFVAQFQTRNACKIENSIAHQANLRKNRPE